MASRRFTVDLAKKKEFINIFLLMPESSVLNAMKQAKSTKEDIADLRMWCFLQRALPGRLIKGLKAYIAGLLPPPPDRRQRKPHTTATSPEDKVADRHQRQPPPISPLTLLLRPLCPKRSPSSITEKRVAASWRCCGGGSLVALAAWRWQQRWQYGDSGGSMAAASAARRQWRQRGSAAVAVAAWLRRRWQQGAGNS
jgi:hypothetical protein